MNWFPHHHPACFCWVCREQKAGHPSDRCHCKRCLDDVWSSKQPVDIPVVSFKVSEWDSVKHNIITLLDAGYYVSPVGEIEGDVYIEVEEEAVEMWRELTA